MGGERGKDVHLLIQLLLAIQVAIHVEWWLASTFNIALFQSIIKAFAKARGAGKRATIVLVLDNAAGTPATG